MKISELIARLETLRAEHGDLEVGVENSEFFHGEPISSVEVEGEQDPGLEPHNELLGTPFVLIS